MTLSNLIPSKHVKQPIACEDLENSETSKNIFTKPDNDETIAVN